MANIFIIIQARMTSTRLPGKVMLPLCGKTVLEVMIERLKSFKKNIIIATTNDGSQKPIIDICKELDLKYYEGDTSNVLNRYYEAAVKYGAEDNDIIVRLTSDCLVIDEEIVKSTIEFFKNTSSDYSSASGEGGYPRGMNTEVFHFSLLKEAHINVTEDFEKEHVTPYIYKTCNNKFKINFLKNKIDYSKYRLTVDEIDDYKAIVEVYKKFNNKIDFSFDELISMLEKNQYIYELNAHVEQKKL